MNVIFEGISGVGKTTILERLNSYFDNDLIIIGDLEYETPIKSVLTKMVQQSPFMNENESFNTSIYESLLLAANHHYVQEKLRDSDKICVYDRDFLSLLVYQKFLIQNEYSNWEEIYDIYRKIVLFNLKKVDLLVYVEAPLDISVKRTEIRDNRKYSFNDIELLKSFKKEYEILLEELKNYMNIIRLNGLDAVEDNVQKLVRNIKSLERS